MSAECPHCRDWGKDERHEDHWPPRLLDDIVDPEEPVRKPRRRVIGSDGASRPERGQP